ncbi:hypothetical protein D187_007200 [Cystobacter fuscus DSM 2262]|uniref:Uncharacterized protein n=1 Tax=Cystobacter fuscus (strain ATCC 25194 / DSM 2262 / NBRC 100088 / M29) TaxID=1242864 RepID=S9P0X4_CYSF2|nr:hypothetical protein D187_007200 [Cystobacter fuscus DSM 2262]
MVARGEARLTITLPTVSGLDVAALVNAFSNGMMFSVL